MAEGTRMLQRRATEAVWNTSDYVLAAGEIGFVTDTGSFKIGNGTSPWSELDYAFDGLYLPILGKAADSELLDGVSADFFVKSADASVSPTNDSYVKRTADGGVKGTNATENDELTSLQQMNAALLVNKQLPVARTITASATLVSGDANSIVMVNHSSLTAQVVATVPPNSSVAYPVGTTIEITSIGAGGTKISPGAGVTINGSTNAMPGYGSVRLVKTGTDTWFGSAIAAGKRLPTIKYRIVASGTSYSSYTFVPWDTLDSNETYNPDNEWFSIPGSGIATARRIIVNKDGEYLFSVALATDGDGSPTFCRLAQMTADNSSSGMKVRGVQSLTAVCCFSTRIRVTAGESFGVQHGAGAGNQGLADAEATGGDPFYFKITRLSD